MFSDIPIKYFNGTHRVKNPSETIENFEDKLRVAGITRITNITDLIVLVFQFFLQLDQQHKKVV